MKKMKRENTLNVLRNRRAKSEIVPYCSEIPANFKEEGCYYTHLTRFFDSPPHFHRHYEIALILSGKFNHFINKKTQSLSAGDLFFIRPDDMHFFGECSTGGVELMNIAFSIEHFDRFREYMDDTDFPFDELLHASYPVIAKVNVQEVREMYYRFDAFRVTAGNAGQVKMAMRRLLNELFGCFIHRGGRNVNAHPVPAWLEITCMQMRKFENFTAPPERMVEISGRSKEHLARTMKKYMGITPSAFVYELRVLHAADLLRFSNLSVL
ncbi:MAG TPA: hypothetical protein DCY75_05790, partial [Clostridiales bacterium]|nr:hypothetical protein [Clostridiales bacterium]